MADQSELLSVEDTAKRFGVSTKTIRRRIQDGSIVAHRLGKTIRVDAPSVTRLLAPANGNGVECVVAMRENKSDQLYRQLGKNGIWTAIVNGVEVSTGTTSAEEAKKRLGILARHRAHEDSSPRTGRRRMGPWSVFQEKGRGFIVVYYDEQHQRRKHRVPADLDPPVTNLGEAEVYARNWYLLCNAERELEEVRHVESAEPIADSHADPVPPPQGKTFKDVAQLWTSGKLAVSYPDHVKLKRSNKTDEFRLAKYAYDVIGNVPISEFVGRAGVELAEKVSANMTVRNPKLGSTSRRHVIQTVSRVLSLAVFPLKLIEHHPLPRGFVPVLRHKRARVCLFPNEERQLLGCTKIPITWRMLIGILTREGLRLSELLNLEWSDVDLVTGTVNLDRNKTDDARLWALSPSVVEALVRWKEMLSKRALRARRLIVHPKSGRLFNSDGAANRLRRYARLAKLERSQLYEKSADRIPLRVHDMRATFVTISLAQGQTETWVADRTGHRSSQMLQNYRRVARTYQELNLGPLAPLHECIPELAEMPAT